MPGGTDPLLLIVATHTRQVNRENRQLGGLVANRTPVSNVGPIGLPALFCHAVVVVVVVAGVVLSSVVVAAVVVVAACTYLLCGRGLRAISVVSDVVLDASTVVAKFVVGSPTGAVNSLIPSKTTDVGLAGPDRKSGVSVLVRGVDRGRPVYAL